MRGNRQIMMREMAIALAVLALYALTLLLPLHQAAGLQRDFNALGYSTLDTWSVCQSVAADETGDPLAAALTCPALGVAKQDLAPLPPIAPIAPAGGGDSIGLAEAVSVSPPGLPDHIGQSRAPPAIA